MKKRMREGFIEDVRGDGQLLGWKSTYMGDKREGKKEEEGIVVK